MFKIYIELTIPDRFDRTRAWTRRETDRAHLCGVCGIPNHSTDSWPPHSVIDRQLGCFVCWNTYIKARRKEKERLRIYKVHQEFYCEHYLFTSVTIINSLHSFSPVSSLIFVFLIRISLVSSVPFIFSFFVSKLFNILVC